MIDWDALPPREQARRRAQRQRTHGSVAGEQRLAIEDARAALMQEVLAFLRERGHAAAANDLEDHAWEPAP